MRAAPEADEVTLPGSTSSSVARSLFRPYLALGTLVAVIVVSFPLLLIGYILLTQRT